MRMVVLCSLILALSTGAVRLAAAEATALDAFAYSADRAPVGRVFHYVKSNLDGSKRLVLSLYFRGPLALEVLKVEADGQYLALVEAELDPVTLTESRMRSRNRLEQGEPQLQMELGSDPGQRRLVAHVARAELPVRPGLLPAHMYNFDFSGLNATLPHLRDPRADFVVGVVDPDFEFLATRLQPEGVQEGGFVYRGEARFRYVGEEVLDDIPCHRFAVGGAAFDGVEGSLWINTADGLIERFEHARPDNPDWSSFRLARIGSRPMDRAGWEAFKNATIRRAMDLRDQP